MGGIVGVRALLTLKSAFAVELLESDQRPAQLQNIRELCDLLTKLDPSSASGPRGGQCGDHPIEHELSTFQLLSPVHLICIRNLHPQIRHVFSQRVSEHLRILV
jgi:hypothetical protein